MTIRILMDGFPVTEHSVGLEASRRAWYVHAPNQPAAIFQSATSPNLKAAISMGQRIQAATSGPVWVSTDDRPPAEGWPR